MKKIILIFSVIVLTFVFISSCKKSGTSDNRQKDSGEIGQYLGDFIKSFVGTDSKGNTFSLDKFKGKVILLNISAMWCGPCRSEASELMDIYNTYKSRGLEIVQCIYQDEEGKPTDISDLKRWVKEFNIDFTVLNDPDKSLVGFFTFSGIPFNVIVDRNFIIRYRGSGFDKGEVKSKIEKLL